MLKKWHILAILVIGISTITVLSISAQESLVPSWIKTTVGFWVNGDSGDREFINAIKWMLENKIIEVSTTQDDGLKAEVDKLSRENQQLKKEISDLKKKNLAGSSETDSNTNYDKVVPYEQNAITIDKEFSAGPFRFHVIDAGYAWADENGKAVEYFQVTLEATNSRGTSVQFTPSVTSLTDSSGYGLQQKYTNGLKYGSSVAPGGKISGYYTFEKPSESGILKLSIEMAVYEDSGLSYNWHHSGELEFELPWGSFHG